MVLDLPHLECITGAHRRYYITPDGQELDSVTTCIGYDKSGLDDWKKRVGEENAKQIGEEAANFGTKIHDMTENYLLDRPVERNDVYKTFVLLKWKLDQIGEIIGLETPLYSLGMKLAGRVDCVGEYKGEMAIIDFKTSRRIKKEEWIIDYWLQTTAYSLMIEELTGIKIEKLVILMVSRDNDVKEFISHRSKWLEPLRQRILDYRAWRDGNGVT
jgi:genome maintenance exonuclease 1